MYIYIYTNRFIILKTTARLAGSGRPEKVTCLARGRKIAHQISAPQKSSWISSGISQWISAAFSNGTSLVSGMFQRIVTFPVDCHWSCHMGFQRHFPMEFDFVISGV